ncbi:SusE domain-containing protein [Flavobacterium sp. RHBU_24]|uniref:SusE domain-containing protein n=1 Tax=Flavobacterium sp. RHBU_24 TaxID=3391185 RepID=UPI0039853AA0
MKTIYSKLLFLFMAVVAVGCSDDDRVSHTNVSAVQALYLPEDNRFYDLAAPGSALFEWEGAKAEDNGVVLYDVVFDKEGGDFSNPVYVIPADGNGFQKSLNLSFTRLNAIAGMAGIEPETVGKLIWTVRSSKGLNFMMAAVSHTIELQRPGGFPAPDQVYITGTASEEGDNASMALPFKKTGASTFEIYTKLSAGDYKFITRITGTPEEYYIDSNNKLKQDGSTAYSGGDKVYRIRVDFSDGSTNITEVQNVQLWFAPNDVFMFDYTYAGHGTWEALNKYIEFRQESWGRDERYKFKFTMSDGSTSSDEWFGSVNVDNNRPNADSPESYWYMVPVTSDRWNNTFKFASEVDYSNVNALIDFSGDSQAYTHSFTIL